MNYPRALAPWAEYLNIFPRELSLALGTMVQRISLAVGSMRSRSLNHAGDIDGFDGIARRGSYEKLVASEWLLADEMPDEFARRAVMGEHLFLELARREPSAARVSLAIFDAGPNQLGAPRIAHLATLIALARRAEAAGARFGWGIVQQFNKPIFPGVSTTEVMHLLDARNTREASEDDINAWRAKVADWKELDDLWVIGGSRLAQFESHRGLSHISVQDIFEPDVNRLSLTVQGVSNAPKKLLLDLPNERACSRLLRDPFEDAAAAPQFVKQSTVPASNLVFSSNGAYLFARSANGGIISFQVPNSPRAGVGRPKFYYPKFHSPHSKTIAAAVGRLGKANALITAHDNLVHFEYVNKRSAQIAEGKYKSIYEKINFMPPQAGSLLQPCYRLLLEPYTKSEVLVVDGRGSLFQFRQSKDSDKLEPGVVGSVWLVASEVLAITPVYSRIVYVGCDNSKIRWRVVSMQNDTLYLDLPFEESPTKAFFGYGALLTHQTFGFLAIEKNEYTWVIISAEGESSHPRPEGTKVVGVSFITPQNNRRKIEPALILLEDDKRTLSLRGITQSERFHTASAPIEHITTSTTAPYVAYSTVDGEVVVYSLLSKAKLCNFVPEEKR
jgi:hypothetical protein